MNDQPGGFGLDGPLGDQCLGHAVPVEELLAELAERSC